MGRSDDFRAPSGALAASPVHVLRRCSQYAADLYAREAGASPLTQRQLAVLMALEAQGPSRQAALVAATGIDRSTLAEMLPRMEARGLIARTQDKQDARANAVRITANGVRALAGLRKALRRAEARLLEPVPAAQRRVLMTLLAKIAAKAGSAS